MVGFRFDRGGGLGDGSLMATLIPSFQKLKANSFTLVELLVVISIIGVLAGLATPAMTKALDKGKQTTDVSNGRQLYTLLFAAANDDSDGGYYFFTTNAIGAANATAAFNKWIEAGGFPYSRKVLAGTGVPVDKKTGNEPIVAQNLFWGCGVGLTTSDDATIPLLFSKGAHAKDMFKSNDITIDAKGPWKDKGVVVVNLGGGASLQATGTGGAGKGTIRSGILTTNIPTNATAVNAE